MNRFFKISADVFIAVIVFIVSLNFANAAENLHKGTGVYQFAESTGKTDDPIIIYYYYPKNWKNGDKIFVVFHGMGRNAEPFMNGLKTDAEEKNFLLICPEFTNTKYNGSSYYNFGHVIEKKKITPSTEWTYNVVNRIIDDVKKRAGATKSKVIFFGHSAGGQFIHRYVFLADEIKADKIFSANAGTYMMPDENINFPYGLKRVPIAEKNLKRAYGKKVIILLGEEDIKRTTKTFPKSVAADKQGFTRLERGKNFFAQSKSKAEELGTKFNWQLITVPKVGHEGVAMARAALNIEFKR